MSSTELQSSDVLETGTPDLPAEVFDVPVNIPLIHQVVVAQQAAARQGTSATRTRGQVRGGGKKPYRQKGTGRARQGSTRAPQFVGGGVVHGPVPRNYAQRTPKKMKAAALRSALSDRARAGRIHVVGTLVEGDTPSTKGAMAALTQVATGAHTLVVLPRGDELGWRSLRNVPEVHLLWADQLNTYDVLVSDDVVFTRAALQAFLDLVAAPPARGLEAAGIDAAPTAMDDTSGPAAGAQHTEADAEADAAADTVADGTGAIREEGNE